MVAIKVGMVAFDCDAPDGGTLQPGGDGTHGLPAGYAIPAGTSEPARLAVMALPHLGKAVRVGR